MHTSCATPVAAWPRHCAWLPPPAAHCSRRHRRSPIAAAAQPDPYKVVGVARGSSRREIRAAYIEQIKQLHPDVSVSGEDTTLQAAALNAAYERLMEAYASLSRDGADSEEDEDPLDVFDRPEAEPSELFVDPFSCYNISPLQWEQLQELGRAAAAGGRDPWYELRQQGINCSEAAFLYLTPRQLEVVVGELDRACAAMDACSLEAAAYWVSDCLLRARVANNRMPSAR